MTAKIAIVCEVQSAIEAAKIVYISPGGATLRMQDRMRVRYLVAFFFRRMFFVTPNETRELIARTTFIPLIRLTTELNLTTESQLINHIG
jgi:hypothetical protein